jgi:hypothetical protein
MEENKAKDQDDSFPKWTEVREDGKTIEIQWLGKEGHSEKYWMGKETEIIAMCRRIGWKESKRIDTPTGKKAMFLAPAMVGLAISEIITAYHIPQVSHVGWGVELAPLGIIAIRGHYTKDNKVVDIYFVDEGNTVCPLVSFATDMDEKAMDDIIAGAGSSAILAPEGGNA